MAQKKGDPAAGDGRAKKAFSHWDANSLLNNQVAAPRQESVTAELIGSTVCTAAGLKVDSSSPLLAICRRLIDAGYDPATPLEASRGRTVCLVVRSICEAAKLEINGRGTGFKWAGAVGTASPVRCIRAAAHLGAP